MQHSFDRHPVIPVLVLERAEDALSTAEALLEGGLSVIEITLRTPHSLEAIERIAAKLPEMHVGAGTVLRPTDVTAARDAGAQFLVSPGLTPDLAAAGLASGLPYLPGAVTPTEIMAAREFGFSYLKFFPAREFGGPAMLRNYASVFPGIVFCPTGGIADADAAAVYLALPNVPVVGGTWIASREAIADRAWPAITARAREAASLARKPQ